MAVKDELQVECLVPTLETRDWASGRVERQRDQYILVRRYLLPDVSIADRLSCQLNPADEVHLDKVYEVVEIRSDGWIRLDEVPNA